MISLPFKANVFTALQLIFHIAIRVPFQQLCSSLASDHHGSFWRFARRISSRATMCVSLRLFCHAQGDALYSMELALSLEKLNFIKLRELHRVAANAEDAQLADFIGECFLYTGVFDCSPPDTTVWGLLPTAGYFM